MKTRTGMVLAILALFVAGLILAGCGAASAPTADKMAAAIVAAGDKLPKTGGMEPDENVELSKDAIAAIEGAGVSEASFRLGIKKMKEDKEYMGEVMGEAMKQAFKKMPGAMPK